MKHYEEVLKLLHDQFDWKLTDSLTTTGKKLVADTIKALKIAENNQSLQLQQTGVKRCFSDDHIGDIARNIAKEYAFENQYIYNQFEEAITKGMKIGRKVIQQNNA